MDSPIVVLAAPDHPLAGENNISLQCLAHEPWLMREKGSGTRIAIERRFAEYGITLYPRLELDSSEQSLAGLGISALSCHARSLNQPGQFAVLDVEGFPILRGWYAVYPRGGSYRWWRGRSWTICSGEARPRPSWPAQDSASIGKSRFAPNARGGASDCRDPRA